MSDEREVARLRACLREIYRTFQYGPGTSSSQAPFIMKMVEEALGWERHALPAGGGGAGFGPNVSPTYATGYSGKAWKDMVVTGSPGVSEERFGAGGGGANNPIVGATGSNGREAD